MSYKQRVRSNYKQDQVGKIIITETPYQFKGHKYRVNIRSENPILPDRLEELIYDALAKVENIGYSGGYTNLEVMTDIKEVDKLPDEYIYDALAKVEKERGETPVDWNRYQAYVRAETEHEPEDVSSQISKTLESEIGGKIVVDVNKVKYLPSEKPKVKTIPITKEMFQKMLEKAKAKKK